MSLKNTRLVALGEHVGKTITVHAWATHLRSSGKVAFADLRDGSGVGQAVFVKSAVSPEVWDNYGKLTLETAVAITGEVRANAKAAGGHEIGVTDLKIIGPSPSDYPIQPKEHGVDFLLDRRHLWLRSPIQRAIFRVRNEIEQAIHDFF